MGRLRLCLFVVLFISFFSIASNVYAGNGQWIRSGSRWWYKHSDGSYTKNNWEKIGGKWYFFDSEGWMKVGWLQTSDGKWYYLNSTTGEMNTSPLYQNNSTYLFNPSGDMYLSKLDVQRKLQQKSNWCWAASTQMVSNYLGYNYSQAQIVEYIYGRDLNLGAFAWQINSALKYATNNSRSVQQRNGKIEARKLRELVDNRKPFITCVAWENKVNLVGLEFEILPTSGHAVVGYGYNLNNNHVLFIDPWNGQHATFSIPATVAESKIKSRFGSSGTGYYSNTIYLQ